MVLQREEMPVFYIHVCYLLSRQEKTSPEAAMNQNPQFHVVLDLDGTTPPITVVSGDEESKYYDAIQNRCKKTSDFRKEYR